MFVCVLRRLHHVKKRSGCRYVTWQWLSVVSLAESVLSPVFPYPSRCSSLVVSCFPLQAAAEEEAKKKADAERIVATARAQVCAVSINCCLLLSLQCTCVSPFVFQAQEEAKRSSDVRAAGGRARAQLAKEETKVLSSSVVLSSSQPECVHVNHVP